MASTSLLLLLLLRVLVAVNGQDEGQPIGCFVPGTCTRSLLVTEAIRSSAGACLVFCDDQADLFPEENIKFFTYDANTQICYCFENCDDVSQEICSNCLSGDVACSDLECYIHGSRVQGTFLAGIITENAQECALNCDGIDDCAWFTFNAEDQTCLFTTDIDSVIDCDTCTYGQSGCGNAVPTPTGLTTLFVCGGGWNGVDDNLVEAEEVYLPFNDVGQQECQALPDMGHSRSDHFAIADIEAGAVLCCGGGYDPQSCHKYSAHASEWEYLEDVLVEDRQGAKAIPLSDGRHWITGGDIGEGDITTEFYSAGTFTRGPDLPLPFNDHCLVEFEPGRVFISGSSYAAVRNAAIIYDLNTETFERLADMVYQRYNHGCGAINTGSSFDFVVAGGFSGLEPGNPQQVWSFVEIYNTETGVWRPGPELPIGWDFMASLQYGNTFLMIGGEDRVGTYLDWIYEYDQLGETWKHRQEKLSQPKIQVAAVLVDAPVDTCVANYV